MSRSLPAAITTAIAASVTLPGVLVEIGFNVAAGVYYRASSRGTVVMNGNVFVPQGIKATGFAADTSSATQEGVIEVVDPDLTLTTFCLLYGVSNRPIKVWWFYGDPAGPSFTLASTDTINPFVGVGDGFASDEQSRAVQINAIPSSGANSFAPRLYITPESGFHYVPAAGSVIAWGGTQYRLEPDNG